VSSIRHQHHHRRLCTVLAHIRCLFCFHWILDGTEQRQLQCHLDAATASIHAYARAYVSHLSVMLTVLLCEKKRKSYAVGRDNGNAHYGLNVTRGRQARKILSIMCSTCLTTRRGCIITFASAHLHRHQPCEAAAEVPKLL
jgi:hypothetical protein